MHFPDIGARRALVAALGAAALLAPFAATAQEAGRLLAVQQRKFRIDHELTLGGTFEPLDAFYKGVAPELAYSFHMDDAWTWEVLRGGYVAQFDTGLRTQLERDYGVAPTQFETLQYYATSNMVWAPLYGKLALRNAAIVHTEAFLSFGGALGHFSGGSFQAGPELGVGARVFLTTLVSVRLDARDALFIHKNQNSKNWVNQVLFISLGLSFALGGGE